MASGKRASMREGPLAALFRSTEEEGAEPEAEVKEDVKRDPVERTPAPEPVEPEPAAEPRRPAASRYGGEVPTPEERLRSVFSSDIPENIMERAPEPVRAPDPVYADQEPIHQPQSPLTHDPV